MYVEEYQILGVILIYAIGIDIVDIQRFQKMVERWGDRFTERILSRRELDYCRRKTNAIPSMAARFAAKEAMIKCLPTDQNLVFRWHEMEVLNSKGGKPHVHLHGELLQFLHGKRIFISLSHSLNSAVAVVVVE